MKLRFIVTVVTASLLFGAQSASASALDQQTQQNGVVIQCPGGDCPGCPDCGGGGNDLPWPWWPWG